LFSDKLVIRETTAKDEAAIRAIHASAFGREAEARLALHLIAAPDPTVSLIAERGAVPVGHVLLSRIDAPIRAAALAPLAVMPHYREMQIGTNLVRNAMKRARRRGYDALFVLGHPGYYERFGFSSKLASPFDVPWKGPNFMALELRNGALAGCRGALRYPEVFSQVD
jgi:putative acetyltransferase